MTQTTSVLASVEETLASRKSFYDLLTIFYKNTLTQEQIDSIASLDFKALGVGEPLLEQGFDDIRRYLRKRNTGTRQALATDYTGAFAGIKTYKEKTAVPCGSLYLEGLGHLYAEEHGRVFAIYRQEGMRVDESLHLPSDHLMFELEFLGKMSEKCLEAIDAGDREMALHKLDISEDFIHNHILNWYSQFESIADKLVETRFYRGVIRITRGYLMLDLETIKDLKDVIPEAEE